MSTAVRGHPELSDVRPRERVEVVQHAPRAVLAAGVFAATTFANAALLFAVQPMFSKMVLPLLGGTPAVWNTCVLFFQVALLTGYLYAHAITTKFRFRVQRACHLGLLGVAILVLPISVPGSWTPDPNQTPTWPLLLLLAQVVGLPFILLSAGAPLLQSWFAGSRSTLARNPYPLYAASNLGSLLVLLSYPLLIEPNLALSTQTRLWSYGYVIVLVLIALSAYVRSHDARLRGYHEAPDTADMETTERDTRAATKGIVRKAPGMHVERSWRVRGKWVLLAFFPASLLMGVTTYLTTDLAPVPLLWVVPLCLYLLSFVFAFSARWSPPLDVIAGVQAVLLVLLASLFVLNRGESVFRVGVLHLGAFFATAVLCHGELAKTTPAPSHLTEFYVWMSIGGTLGGAFNAVLAPLLFDSLFEYPLALLLVACVGIEPSTRVKGIASRFYLEFVLPAAVFAAAFVARSGRRSPYLSLALVVACGVACLLVSARRRRFGTALAAMLAGAVVAHGQIEKGTLLSVRSFFATYDVVRDGDFNVLRHGTTTHGAQQRAVTRNLEPLTYYYRGGPVSQVLLRSVPDHTTRAVAVVGLGTGSLACYGRAGELWSFFEIDPMVQEIATDPRYFSYLRDCAPTVEVTLGDARLSLARRPRGAFDVIVVDAFNSDAIPVHLLTREAIELYFSKLRSDGVVLLHISNRYLDLAPVIGSLAAAMSLAAFVGGEDALSAADIALYKRESRWIALSRDTGQSASIAALPGWRKLRGENVRPWSDDYSNVWDALR